MLRTLSALVILSFIPSVGLAASRIDGVSPRPDNTTLSERPEGTVAPEPLSQNSYYSEVYSDVMTIVRALVAPRTQVNSGRVSPRNNNITATTAEVYTAATDTVITSKQDYINFLKGTVSGKQSDCWDRYNKFTNFFRYSSNLTGQIGAKSNALATGRLDTICEFMDYAQWCFSLGFAYSIRDAENYDRTAKGYKCFTYQEFCESRGKVFDVTKVDQFLSKVIDEITFYNSNIKDTDKNTVMVTTEKYTGNKMTTNTSWKGYNTDTWIAERIPTAEMVRLLCR